jgi:predicted DNA-binding transcriptional regulator AlpA
MDSRRSAVIRWAAKVEKHPSGFPDKQQTTLLTESQSAQRLGVSLSTLRRWRKNGMGPKFFLLGGILRYRAVDLDEFVARHTGPTGVV